MSAQHTDRPETATLALDVAQRLVQTRGYNAFSYADIAAELGITKAALHYHFPTKSLLGLALMDRYEADFLGALRVIDSTRLEPLKRLNDYVELYRGVLLGERMCLCGMLAAEYDSLPKSLQAGVGRFFAENERWLADVLAAGRHAGSLDFVGPPLDSGRAILAGLEGALLLSRPSGDVARFDAVAAAVIAGVVPRRTSR